MPTITGTSGHDYLEGTNEDDSISGLAGDDDVWAHGGNDTLYGGEGHDELFGDDGNDLLYGGLGDDRLIGGAGDDTLNGQNGMDELYGHEGQDVLNGGVGNDALQGNEGNDQLDGGDGDDEIYGDDMGGSGLGDGNDRLDGGIGRDSIYGGGGDDTITGGADDDYVVAGEGSDHVDGGAGDDFLNASDMDYAPDTVLGGIGNDRLLAAYGDSVDGGDGTDTLFISFSDATAGVRVDFRTLTSGSTLTVGGAVLSGIEYVGSISGSAYGDTIIAGAVPGLEGIQLAGWSGDDHLTGSAGTDIISGGDGNDVLRGGVGFDPGVTPGTDLLYGEAGNDTIYIGADGAHASGGEGDDTIHGGRALDHLYGDNGSDTLDGGAGADWMYGGNGDDLYIIDSTDEIEEGWNSTDTDTVQVSFTYTLLDYFENLTLAGTAAINGFGNDLDNGLIGNGAANTLDGRLGDDTLNGRAGADTLNGGGGNDALQGGAGNDRVDGDTGFDTAVYLEASAAVSVSLQLNGPQATGGAGSDTLVEIEGLVGSAFGDRLVGDDSANLLRGAAGNDDLDGDAGDDQLFGDEGDDRLFGSIGADLLFGGSGNDTYDVDAGDTVTEWLEEGTDLVLSAESWTLSDNVENLTLTGTAAVNGTGNALANVIVGNSAANVLNGLGGADSLRGGAGNDSYVVDNAGDVTVESVSEGTDLVSSSVSYALGENVENLSLTGRSRINATGNSQVNILIGNAAANVLDGLGGADTMQGGLGHDTYVVDNGSDVVTEASSAGTDLVRSYVTYALTANVENLTLMGTDAIDATGNALANTITGNSAANRMWGGGGNDTYIVQNVGDRAIESSVTGGTDLVKSSVSFTLGTNVENLTLIGTQAINGTGNSLANLITGNRAANFLSGAAGDDVLRGGAGADTIRAGTGNDVLTGGTGGDTFLFDTALSASSNVDRITDFSVRYDTIRLDNDIFTAAGPIGTLSAAAFRTGTAAQDADDRIIYDSATGRIYYDADGNGAGAAVLFAQVNAGQLLTNADFVVVG